MGKDSTALKPACSLGKDFSAGVGGARPESNATGTSQQTAASGSKGAAVQMAQTGGLMRSDGWQGRKRES